MFENLGVVDQSDPAFHYGISASRNARPFRGMVFHHTADKPIQNLVNYGKSVDRERGGAFGYHFYVGKDGEIIQGAPIDKRTNHIKPPSHRQRKDQTGLSNADAIGVTLIGAENGATPEQRASAERLGRALMQEYGIKSEMVYGHGDLQRDRQKTEGAEMVALLRGQGGSNALAGGPSNDDILQEARRRGLVSDGPSNDDLLQEARRRGLVGGSTPVERIQAEGSDQALQTEIEGLVGEATGEKQPLVSGIVDQTADGLMAGFSDNAAGMMNAIVDQALKGLGLGPEQEKSFWESYREGVDRQRGNLNQFAEDNPNTALASQIAGGLATGAGMVRGGATLMKSGASLPSAIGRGAAEGAAYGAVYGAGEADGENVAQGAVSGAVAGLFFGGAAPIAFSALRQIPVGARTVGNLLGVGSSDRKAAALVSKALSDDGPLSMAIPSMPDTLMDLAGPATRRLAGAARAVPSKGSTALEEMLEARVQSQADRIAADTLEFLGSTGDDFYKSTQDLIARRAARAKPVYDKLNTQSMPVTTELAKLMERPSMGAAFARAVKSVEDMTGQAVSLDGSKIPFMVIDQAKKHLDAMAKYGRTPQGAADGFDTAAVKALTKRYLTAVDKHFPDYNKARALYQGDAKILDAMESGRAFMKGDADEMAAEFIKMPQAEREAFRIGAARQIKDMVERARDTHDAAARLWTTPAVRKRLKTIAPKGSGLGRYLQRLRRETQFTKTRNEVMGGSQTQPRQVAAAEAAQDAISLINGGTQAVVAALRWLSSRGRGMDKATASRVAEILSNNDPAEALRFINSQKGTWLVRQNAAEMLPELRAAARGASSGLVGAETSRRATER